MVFEAHGRAALITGAGSSNGIGFATARMLAESGARVLLAGHGGRVHDRAHELVRDGLTAYAWQGDLTDSEQVQSLIDYAKSNLRGLDILVNNAGMTSSVRTAADAAEQDRAAALSDEGWRSAIARNLDSAFYVTRAALPLLRQSAAGRIVLVSSVTGPLMAMRNDAGYATAKAGMVGLMRSIAVDEAADGITCNAVAPGWIATESQSAVEAQQGSASPLKRSGTPHEVAALIAFLSSVEAGYITGQVIAVDGGNSIAEERG